MDEELKIVLLCVQCLALGFTIGVVATTKLFTKKEKGDAKQHSRFEDGEVMG